jgi:cold shock CspA family protein
MNELKVAKRFQGTIIAANRNRGFMFLIPDEHQIDYPAPNLSLFVHCTEVPSREVIPAGTRVSFEYGIHNEKPVARRVEKIDLPPVPVIHHPSTDPLAKLGGINPDAEVAPEPVHTVPVRAKF